MKVAVCTLFERQYHLGAAVLVNSLCRAGFTGTIYAGFRGPLPPWAQARAKAVSETRWEMTVTREVRIVFLRLETAAHFTNYKPEFLLRLETLVGGETDAVIYCDPDIVLNGPWRYLEEWLSCGIAVCEDINSPLHRNNPRRVGWKRFFEPLGFTLQFRDDEYANGGFIGLEWKYRQFLVTWQTFIGHVAASLGGADVVGIGGGKTLEGSYGFADCFHQPDQDALNAALEAHPELPVSFQGAGAMGFLGGDAILPHALGAAKPWTRDYVRDAFRGRPPRLVDKIFWKKSDAPLQPFTPGHVSTRRLQIAFASGMGRIMRRG